MSAQEKAGIIRSWLEEHHARDAVFFDLQGANPLAEVMALATATSVRHARSLADGILELCRERDISINRLSSMSGVTQSTVNNIVSGRNRSTTISTIKKLCDGLGITIEEFFHSDLFRELEQEIQ